MGEVKEGFVADGYPKRPFVPKREFCRVQIKRLAADDDLGLVIQSPYLKLLREMGLCSTR